MRGRRRWECPMWIGVRCLPWLRVLARHRFRVAPSRIPRAVAITAASVGNELLRGIQQAIWGRGLAAARLTADPIVILGHWRSGTTLLHELLACDPRLHAPNTIQCGAPSHFVLSEEFARDHLGFLLPDRRPMDAMRMGFERPQEDEIALCNLGQPSPWWVVAFPNDPPPDEAYADLEALDERSRRRWIDAWTGFLRHVQFEHPGRLVLKNPLHTHRVPLIRGLYPAADFIHIARDPHDMVPSCIHFWRRISESHGLQRPTGAGLEDRVVESVGRMDRRLAATWSEIPAPHRYQTRYEELVADPVGVLRAIYSHFGWPGAAEAEPRWLAYLAEVGDYRRNEHRPDPALEARIARDLADVLIRHGYPARRAESPGASQTPDGSSERTRSPVPA